MKATGIVRKIDDLGRIVIPKEIRKKMKIREGATLEIFIDDNNGIVLNKYEPMGDILNLSENITKMVANICELNCLITDSEKVIATNGTIKKEYIRKNISTDIIKIMYERICFESKNEFPKKILEDDIISKYNYQMIVPIIYDCDAIGTICVFSIDKNQRIDENIPKFLKSVAELLSHQKE